MLDPLRRLRILKKEHANKVITFFYEVKRNSMRRGIFTCGRHNAKAMWGQRFNFAVYGGAKNNFVWTAGLRRSSVSYPTAQIFKIFMMLFEFPLWWTCLKKEVLFFWGKTCKQEEGESNFVIKLQVSVVNYQNLGEECFLEVWLPSGKGDAFSWSD